MTVTGLSPISVAVIEHQDQRQFGEETNYFSLQLYSTHGEKLRPETQGWKLETGTEAEAIEECCLARQWWSNL